MFVVCLEQLVEEFAEAFKRETGLHLSCQMRDVIAHPDLHELRVTGDQSWVQLAT